MAKSIISLPKKIAMAIQTTLITELKHEASNTRKMLERLPEDKLSWKPHEKSKSLGQLAAHVAEIPRWIIHLLSKIEFDMERDAFDRVKFSSRDEIISDFEQILEQAVEALQKCADGEWKVNWTFKRGEHKIFELPREAAMRSLVMNHLVHHRGQLSVYLRLLNVPVPGMYGPSADER